MSAVTELAHWSASLQWGAVPADVQSKIGDHIIDTVGVMCAGLDVPAAATVRAAVAAQAPASGCTVVGTNLRLPGLQAAFLNAFHGRIHTYDDTMETGPVHPGSSVIAAALAAAETHDVRGEDFLAGVLTGYETVARIVTAFGPSHYARGFHTTGTCNAFGAAAAACRARGLSAAATAGALGLVGSMAAGLRQYQIDGNISDSALNGAHAALAGVMAADLAAVGLSGAEGVLDGKFGLGTIATAGADFPAALRGLGETYLFRQTAIKPYPTCRFTHGPLTVLDELQRTHGFTARDVAGIDIATFHQSIEVSDKPEIKSRSDALLSHQMSAALLVQHGAIDLGMLDGGAYAKTEAADLASRVRVIHDSQLESQYPANWPHRITVHLRDGSNLEGLSPNPPGGMGDQIPTPIVEAKFAANSEAALGSNVQKVIEQIRHLEREPGMRKVARLLCETNSPLGNAGGPQVVVAEGGA
jgi:2-methylcitrate dehydratase PrpD